MILGLENPEIYDDFFKSNKNSQFCEICLLRSTLSGNDEDAQRRKESGFTQASFKGLFVPKINPRTHRLSYVDIVKHTSPKRDATKTDDLMVIAARKVSNASTISTQADEESLDDIKETESKVLQRMTKPSHQDDTNSLASDILELAYTTKQRKIRIESRKRELQSKKNDIGLLAVIPCPREEPDRSNIF